MIFVYPAIISGSVDSKIGSAVAKVLEQYFLLHIQEAIQNNEIRIVTKWKSKGMDPDNGTYGPLLLQTERKKEEGNIILESSLNPGKKPDPKNPPPPPDEIVDLKKKYDNLSSRFKNARESKEYKEISDECDNIINSTKTIISNFIKQSVPPHIMSLIISIKEDLETLKQKCNSEMTLLRNSKETREKSDEERKRKKFEEEEATKKHQQYETHGMYKVSIMKGVSFQPTMANMSVRLQYIGGPSSRAANVTSAELQEISVGTKVLPLRLVDNAKLEDAILDDYFTTTIQSKWKQTYRAILRELPPKLRNWARKLADKMNYPMTSNVLLAPQGFVNSSSFEHRTGSPSFYHYSAAIVIFEKMDFMKEEGANFFLNRTQLDKMFKMGWNSFCILDSTNEEAIFVSSMDGGYMHVIPYSYIFNNLGMDTVYKDMNDLRKRASPFRLHRGSFSNFLSKMTRESRLFKACNLLREKKNEGKK